MLLVFLIFLILILLIISLRFEIEIENFESSNYKKQFQDNLIIKFKIFILDRLKIIQIKLNKEKMKQIYLKQKPKKIDAKKLIKKLPKSNKEKIKILQIINLKKVNLYLEIGTEDVMVTTIIIPVLATILSIIFAKKSNSQKCFYKLQPIYTDKNIYKINLNCIISIKMIHIINIMWRILRKRDDINERTSNRGAYAYRYGQH